MNSYFVEKILLKNVMRLAKKINCVKVGVLKRKRIKREKIVNFFRKLNQKNKTKIIYLALRTAPTLKLKIQLHKVLLENTNIKSQKPVAFLGSIRSLYITSPNYPQNYPNYQNRAWNAWTGTGYVLGFNFGTFDLEEGYDWVKVTDQVSGRVLFHNYPRGAPSGKPRTFVSDSNRVRIQFYSDYSVTKKGFLLNIWGRQKSKDKNDLSLYIKRLL